MRSCLMSCVRVVACCLIVYIVAVAILTPAIWRKVNYLYVNASTGETRRDVRFMGIRLTSVTEPTVITLYATTTNACDIKNDWHLVLGGYREKLTAFGPALYQIGLLTNAWQYAGQLPEDVKKRTAEDLLRLWALGKSCHLSGRYISEFGHYALQSEGNPDTPPISMSDLDRLMYSVTNKGVHQGQPQ